MDLRGSVNPKTIWQLIRFVREHNIDILDSHSSRDASYAMFVHLLCNTKVIRSRHVTDKIKNDFFHRLIWKIGNDHIITTAKKIKNDIINLQLAKADKIDVALAGVDEKRFDYRRKADRLKSELGIPNDHIVISNIGMIRKDKGQLFYVRACMEITKVMENVTFLQVGEATDATKGYKEEVLSAGEKLIESGRLKFLGYHSDIENYLALSDIVVVASIATEAQTRLVSQAFLMKKNIVATDVGGLPEMIEHDATGILCPPQSPEAITKAVIYLLENDNKRTEIQEQAYTHALEYMTFEKMMKQMVGIYKKVFEEYT